PTPQEAIHKLRETEDMLSKKQEYLEKKIEQEIMVAKKNGTKNKRAALQALKRKKRLEQQLIQIDGTLSTIEFQREALENANTNTEVLKNMSMAAKAIKGVHEKIDMGNIDSLMDDITEQQQIAQEISEAISQPFGDQFDEDELLAELEELEQEDLEESMKTMGGLPTVPTSKLPSTRPSHRTRTNHLDHEEDKKIAASNHLSELRLILLGWRWPGKSLTGNTILGYEEFRLERAAEFSVKRDAERLGRKLTVVDTPGWFSAQTTPAAYQQEMTRSLAMCPPGPHAFLLVVPVGMFTEIDRVRIEENLVLFGEAVWRHTIVVFTWAEVLKNMPIERHIRRQGGALQWVLDKCKKRYHVINNDAFGEHTQVPQLIEKLEKMVAEEGGYFKAMTEEERAKIQVTVAATDENSNPKEVKEKRELGARPKQNCSFSSLQNVDAESPHSQKLTTSDESINLPLKFFLKGSYMEP
ncbi:GTPase IMAP family member 4-like, partial [Clarias magur]